MSPQRSGKKRADEADCPGNKDSLSASDIESYLASEDSDPHDGRDEIPSQLQAAHAHSYYRLIKCAARCSDTRCPNQ
jgi:hypothetical protein